MNQTAQKSFEVKREILSGTAEINSQTMWQHCERLLMAKRLACSPPIMVDRVTPDYHTCELCRTMPFVSGFTRGSPVSPALSFQRCSILISTTLIGSQDLDVKSRPNIFTNSKSLAQYRTYRVYHLVSEDITSCLEDVWHQACLVCVSTEYAASWPLPIYGNFGESLGNELDSTILCRFEHRSFVHWLLLELNPRPGESRAYSLSQPWRSRLVRSGFESQKGGASTSIYKHEARCSVDPCRARWRLQLVHQRDESWQQCVVGVMRGGGGGQGFSSRERQDIIAFVSTYKLRVLNKNVTVTTVSVQSVYKLKETYFSIRRTGFNPQPSHSGFSQLQIVPDYATDRWVFSGISRFPGPCIRVLLHSHLVSPSSALKTLLKRHGAVAREDLELTTGQAHVRGSATNIPQAGNANTHHITEYRLKHIRDWRVNHQTYSGMSLVCAARYSFASVYSPSLCPKKCFPLTSPGAATSTAPLLCKQMRGQATTRLL
ncbi:hypothetical protein PR048_003893 [Dryococelus australis]|uniref:Uncharacterized protein n=1 Tax=Dryococelus australis TaxID=614101 RepID=A0ABQ9IPB6_9NEOP|nr:hypothetical protein PR048_003893 [Dryococelus australis]